MKIISENVSLQLETLKKNVTDVTRLPNDFLIHLGKLDREVR